MSKAVAFYTLGCKVNQYDSQAMLERFRAAGYQTVPFSAEADVYVINTCTVTGVGDKKSLQAARRMAEDGGSDIEDYLVTAGIPDPDLLIRTSGEKRISNFMLWQLAYTEFVFTDTLWPDFRKEEYKNALLEYASRDRRFGKVK